MLIFWDIDGTLMHCGADGTYALNAAFKQLYGIEEACHSVGIGRAMDLSILKSIMTKFEIPLTDDEMTKIEKSYIANLKTILSNDENNRVLPGVKELLSRLKEKGYINSLLTSNIKAGAITKLSSVGLENDFTGGGFGDTGDAESEKWDIARMAVEDLSELTDRGYDPENIILIGDSVYDIKTARRAGYKIIAVATGWMEYDDLLRSDPDYLFEDLADTGSVIAVIDKINENSNDLL